MAKANKKRHHGGTVYPLPFSAPTHAEGAWELIWGAGCPPGGAGGGPMMQKWLCGGACNAGSDVAALRPGAPPGDVEDPPFDCGAFDDAYEDGDGLSSLARPLAVPAPPQSERSTPRRCDACDMSFSAAAFDLHRLSCAKLAAPEPADALVRRAVAATARARYDAAVGDGAVGAGAGGYALDDAAAEAAAVAAAVAESRARRFDALDEDDDAAPRVVRFDSTPPPRRVDELYGDDDAQPPARPYAAFDPVGERAKGDERARLLANFPEDVFGRDTGGGDALDRAAAATDRHDQTDRRVSGSTAKCVSGKRGVRREGAGRF